jgi:DMSO/TMAO reductase YedYZ molybdopterin-dependent catalytic subunit
MSFDLRISDHALNRRALLRSLVHAGVAAAMSGLAPGMRPGLLAQGPAPKDRLIVRSQRPEDLETPVALLDSWITPNHLFYVRSHLYTPSIDPGSWTLSVGGEVERPLTLRLDELRQMPRVTMAATLECAGNGRAYFDPPVAGVQWEKGAVGNARWTGVRLADLLKRAGIRASSRFIWLDGADRPMASVPDFVRQLPIEKAMHPDTILALEMNGAALPLQHGFPVRAIVPGWEGAYSVKWLTDIQASVREHDGFFVQTGYRYPVRRVAPGAAVDPKDMAPLVGLAVKSIITSPQEGSALRSRTALINGFAWAGEAEIARVDLSFDSGSTWVAATLGKDQDRYAWRQFTYEWRAPGPGSYLICSRASDTKGRVQPIAAHWNPSGYLWNAVDRVRIDVS